MAYSFKWFPFFMCKFRKFSFVVPLLNLLRCVKFFRCLSSVSKKNPCRFLVAISSLHSHFDYKKSVAVPLRFLLCFYCVFIKYRRPVVARFLSVRSLFIPKNITGFRLFVACIIKKSPVFHLCFYENIVAKSSPFLGVRSGFVP